MWLNSQFLRRKTTLIIKREHSRQLGCTQKSSTTSTRNPSQLPHKYPIPFSTKQGIQREQAVTDKMGTVVFRSGNAIRDPCCKVFQVRDSLRELICKDKAKDNLKPTPKQSGAGFLNQRTNSLLKFVS